MNITTPTRIAALVVLGAATTASGQTITVTISSDIVDVDWQIATIDTGFDLSSLFTGEIDGVPRTGAYDLGADKAIPGGLQPRIITWREIDPYHSLFRSVGPSGTTLVLVRPAEVIRRV